MAPSEIDALIERLERRTIGPDDSPKDWLWSRCQDAASALREMREENKRLERLVKAATAPRMSDYGPDTPHDELLVSLNTMKAAPNESPPHDPPPVLHVASKQRGLT